MVSLKAHQADDVCISLCEYLLSKLLEQPPGKLYNWLPGYFTFLFNHLSLDLRSHSFRIISCVTKLWLRVFCTVYNPYRVVGLFITLYPTTCPMILLQFEDIICKNIIGKISISYVWKITKLNFTGTHMHAEILMKKVLTTCLLWSLFLILKGSLEMSTKIQL